MFLEGDEARAQYIKRMEYIIAKHCSTKNLNIGEYRYPVHYKKNGKSYYADKHYYANVSMNEVSSMQYKFGAHTMNIGRALEEILEFLEGTIDASAPFDFFDDGKDD